MKFATISLYIVLGAFATSAWAQSCGLVGFGCASNSAGVLSSVCVLGRCVVTCQPGYLLSVDGSSCVSTCADGSDRLGLTCVRYGCSNNQQCITQTKRSDSQCYSGVCFSQSTNPIGLLPGSPCGLLPVSLGDDNQCAAGLVCLNYKCTNTNSPTTCGGSSTNCPVPANGAATCNSGTCGYTCKTGYRPLTTGTGCVLSPSTRSKMKRSQPSPQLCPAGESACPIAGAASFGSFVNSSDRVKDFAHSLGGFECIDTHSDLQSCGGCASLGTGSDCTSIAHASEVGCSNGKCVIFGCKKGYVPALDSETCVKGGDAYKRASHVRFKGVGRKKISH